VIFAVLLFNESHQQVYAK